MVCALTVLSCDTLLINGIAPLTIGGNISISNFTVPAGQATLVTSDLTVNASGNIRVEGSLIAADSQPGGKGISVSLIAAGDIEVMGIVQAGGGGAAPGAPGKEINISQQNSTDQPGGNGGEVELSAGGNLMIRAGAMVGSGNGGQGGTGLIGGAGGSGGHVKLGAGNGLTVEGMLIFGNGGTGGVPQSAANLTGQNVGGTGGDSGLLFVNAGHADWPDYDPIQNSIALVNGVGPWSFAGGLGGSGGLVFLADVSTNGLVKSPDSPTAQTIGTVCASDTCTFRAADGGNGFFAGGVGGFIVVAVTQLPPGERDGPVIKAYAGNGGSLTRRQDPKYGNSVAGRLGHAGTGGFAHVIAPMGQYGEAGHPDGGFGGTAIAYGGNGGNANFDLLQYGGEGGQAEAQAGAGGWGNSGCTSIGNGGAGGIANAFGGDGGSGGYAGNGGGAIARGGHGGEGGSGGPGAGAGGAGGSAVATAGDPGQHNPAFNGDTISGTVEQSSQGQTGIPGTPHSQTCN